MTETELFDLCVDSGASETSALAIARELSSFVASDALLTETSEAAEIAVSNIETVLQDISMMAQTLDEMRQEAKAAADLLGDALKARAAGGR